MTNRGNRWAISAVLLVLGSSLGGCTVVKRLAAANYGVGVADETWAGVYQVPGTGEAGSVVAEFREFADLYSGKFSFRNETYNFNGAGELRGHLSDDDSFELSGTIQDEMQGASAIVLAGSRRGDTMEGTYRQVFGAQSVSGNFVLVRLSKTTYLGGLRSQAMTPVGKAFVDLGADPSGLLGPARRNAYGPGIHADSTGRPFRWRTDDGSMAFGAVRPNVYGPGIGADATGRPVRAQPLW